MRFAIRYVRSGAPTGRPAHSRGTEICIVSVTTHVFSRGNVTLMLRLGTLTTRQLLRVKD